MTAYSPDPRDLTGRVPRSSEALAELSSRARYSRWDGSQRLPDLEADEILQALSDDVMAEGDIAEALRRLMERGWRSGDPTRPDLPGLQDLMERLARRREEMRERYDLGDVLGDIRRELEEIVADERAGVERRLEHAADEAPDADTARVARDLAARRLDRLDGLPKDLGERIQDLREYDFLEPDARERFDALVERLSKQVLDQFVQGMSDAIRSVTPDDLAARWCATSTTSSGSGSGAWSRTFAISWPSTAASSRAPRRSTTSSTSSPSGWPRCSRSCAR
jgi:uncharacterized protein with von Willebrand factor type A (vWA) domain